MGCGLKLADLMLTCSKFLTTSEYAPRLHARPEVEESLPDDAMVRGWLREVERQKATRHRIVALMQESDEPDSRAQSE